MPVSSGDVMISPLMTAATSRAVPGGAKAAEQLKDALYRKYMERFMSLPAGKTDPTAMATAARAAGAPPATAAPNAAGLVGRVTGSDPALTSGGIFGGLAGLLGLGGPKDIELPNESGVRDPRLPPPSLLDTLKMSKETAKRLLRER